MHQTVLLNFDRMAGAEDRWSHAYGLIYFLFHGWVYWQVMCQGEVKGMIGNGLHS